MGDPKLERRYVTAFKKGEKAGKAGVPRTANPYRSFHEPGKAQSADERELCSSWEDGWKRGTFLCRNSPIGTPLSRTQDEILAFLQENDDLFGAVASALLCYMDFEHADPFMLEASKWRREIPLEVLVRLRGGDVAEIPEHMRGSTVVDIDLDGGFEPYHPWTVETWETRPNRGDFTREDVLHRAHHYASFAWSKIGQHRAQSARRSVCKYVAWMYLLGRDDLVSYALEPSNYGLYGAPIIAKMCRAFGWRVPQTKRYKNMIRGQPCRSHCEDCCDTKAESAAGGDPGYN